MFICLVKEGSGNKGHPCQHIYSACDLSYLSESCYVVGSTVLSWKRELLDCSLEYAEVCEDYVGTWFETDRSALLVARLGLYLYEGICLLLVTSVDSSLCSVGFEVPAQVL